MEMTLRWYGAEFDTVTLKQIRQIPGVTGVITTLYDTQPGEVWTRERIRGLKEEVEADGLHISGIESVNIHDAIKTGARREKSISRTILKLKRLKIWGRKIFIWYAAISCRSVTSTISTWRFIRMIRPGAYLGFRVSSLIRTTFYA